MRESEAPLADSWEIWSQTQDKIPLLSFWHPDPLLGSRLAVCSSAVPLSLMCCMIHEHETELSSVLNNTFSTALMCRDAPPLFISVFGVPALSLFCCPGTLFVLIKLDFYTAEIWQQQKYPAGGAGSSSRYFKNQGKSKTGSVGLAKPGQIPAIQLPVRGLGSGLTSCSRQEEPLPIKLRMRVLPFTASSVISSQSCATWINTESKAPN